MPAKRKRRAEWMDPGAPTELTGELAAVCSDLEGALRDCVQELSLLGVEAVPSSEPDGYEFPRRDHDLTKIARHAYELGSCFMQWKSLQHELDLLLSKHAGILKSAESRTITRQRRDDEFLKVYATRMKDGGVTMKTLAAEMRVGKSVAYDIVRELNEFLDAEARRLRLQQPGLPREELVAVLVTKHGSRPGVNRQTIEKAIAGLK